MIKVKTKREIRQELEDEVSRFLEKGGAIEDVKQGVSGKESSVNIHSRTPFNQEAQTYTPLTDTINALDARKQKPASPPPSVPRKPRKKIIYDDFGDPLREVWEE